MTKLADRGTFVAMLSRNELEDISSLRIVIVDPKQRILTYYEQLWVPDNIRELPNIE